MQNGEVSDESVNSEKTTENNQERKTNKICIKNLSPQSTKEEITQLTEKFGKITRCDIVVSNTDQKIAYVTFDSIEQSTNAYDSLNNNDYNGRSLKIEYISNTKSKRVSANTARGGRGTGYPLRILVPSDFVGAIIGRKGQTIKTITTHSRARVDVHCKENTGLLEKVISIYGQPDNCSNACKEILRVMQQECQNANRNEISLKMLAEDRYCGRIIGKKGTVIKQIRSETDTKIYVSNVQDVPAVFPDRVITITGELEQMQKAENIISSKLRECYENESASPVVHSPYISPATMAPFRMPFVPQPPPQYMQHPHNHHGHSQQPPMPLPYQMPIIPFSDCCHIRVPHTTVGSIIGAGGGSIKQIIRDSGAFVTIEQKNENDTANERIITIKGMMDAQFRAIYFIIDRIKGEGYTAFENFRLHLTIRVPRSMVGRVIGKNGKNVRDVQRMTGAIIKLPEESSGSDDTSVDIFGNFMSLQQAMYQIRGLISSGTTRQE